MEELRTNRYWYTAELVRWVDADTVELFVDVGFETWVKVTARVHGIDAPEMHKVKHDSEEYAKGIAAKEFAEQTIPPGVMVVVNTFQDKKGKYGRWLADIYFEDSVGKPINLSEHLIENGHAVRKEY